ncbi:MAG TPA: ComEC/Rec2 family competence protein [Candidatus Acidoferrales bacterium]|nr:ComEC/Rec2 family competence protein [Candidatus Acidoferrales bacterium]
MRLPALWIALAFAAGILASMHDPLSPGILIVASAFALVLAAVAILCKRLVIAWALALAMWVALGALAANLERASLPVDHVARLIAAGRLDTSDPLRWTGRLREDPIRLPWGYRYEIDLEQVEIAGAQRAVSGGLRANLYNGPHVSPAPEGLRAGERVEALMRARPPRDYLDPGAFDIRGALERQKIDLVGSLRSGALLRLIGTSPPTFLERCARARGDLLARLDGLYAENPSRAAVLRAMLLGDRTFLESDVVTAFQKTSAYHVLVVAGLHVAALLVFILWLCRRLRIPLAATTVVTLAVLAAYLAVVQDRPPILRAAAMAGFYLLARPLFRRIDLLNTIALAGLALLIWRPSSVADSSFQLSFLAAGVIAGLALPWMERTSQPYRAGLGHLGDVTRDATHPPRVAQFRIELRAAATWAADRLPARIAAHAAAILSLPIRCGLRLWDIVILSLAIQLGMMPSLAQEFHRVTLTGPISNIPAVILTGVIVPLGYLCLALAFVWRGLAIVLARGLNLCVVTLLTCVDWFARLPRVSYRIPGPPAWLFGAFLAALVLLSAISRREARRRSDRKVRRQPLPFVLWPEQACAAILAALAVLVATHPFAPNLSRGRLEVTTLDVGQGDSIFAAFPDGRTMLVDGGGLAGSEWIGGYRSGPDIGEEVVSPFLWSRGLERLDVVALTHADHDHIDGLRSVLENFRVGQLWVGRDQDKPAFKTLIAEARTLGIPVVHKTAGAEFDWGGATGEVLWPRDWQPVAGASNNDSLVLHLADGRESFLLTGDIEQKVESSLVDEHAQLASVFLKVPHHGSKTSSTQAFLEAVAPKLAVVSVGAGNPFGHPAPSVVERYQNDGVRLLRTDRDGAVTALTDGREFLVRTFVAPSWIAGPTSLPQTARRASDIP